jgi:hypothetical protein
VPPRSAALVTCGLALLWASAARAIEPGGAVFVRTQAPRVLSEANASARPLKVSLAVGQQLVWLGVDSTKLFHRVAWAALPAAQQRDCEKAGRCGWLHVTALTPRKPADEVLESLGGKPISGVKVASSGAATKALSEAALKYGNTKGAAVLSGELITAESIASKVKPSDIAARNARVGLSPGGGKK